MPKGGGKSSASSATRKKQAAKAAKKAGLDAPSSSTAGGGAGTAGGSGKKPPQRGQKKDKRDKKAPKKKVFIPPPKPPQPAPDPLDALGLAALLPPDLVVHLRKASKKDVLTRQRALEGLQAWIRGEVGAEDATAVPTLSEEERVSALVLMLPSWVHIFPRLSISPTRRLRILTAQILTELLAIEDVRAELLLSAQYAEALIGPWAVLAWDTDRQTARTARDAWDKAVSWDTPDDPPAPTTLCLHDHLAALLAHLSVLLLTLSPSTTLAHNAPHVPTPAASTSALQPDSSLRDAKNRDESVEEDVLATDRRLAAGALGSLAWLITTHPSPLPADQLERLLSSPSLWSSLAPVAFDAGGVGEEEGQLPFLGLASPPTRQRAWDLLKALVSADVDLVRSQVLGVAAPIALVSAWEERDQLVQKNMLVALLPFLRAMPEAWRVADAALGGDDDADEDDDGEEDEDDDHDDEEEGDGEHQPGPSTKKDGVASSSPTFAAFERWIQGGCGGNPEGSFPTIVLFLATAPPSILPVSTAASSRFLADFAKALHAGALQSRPAVAAYISALCDCVVFFALRLLKGQNADASRSEEVVHLVSDQLGGLWEELVLGQGGGPSEEGETQGRRLSDLVSERATAPFVSCVEQLASFEPAGAAISVDLLKRVAASTLATAEAGSIQAPRAEAMLARTFGPLERLRKSVKLASDAKAEIEGLVLGAAQSALTALSSGDVDGSKLGVFVLSDLFRRFPAVFASSTDVLDRAIAAGSERIPAIFAAGSITARDTISVLAALSAVSERAAESMQEIWPRMVQVVLQLPDAGSQAGAVVELLPAIRQLGAAQGQASDGALNPALRTALSDIAIDLTQKLCEGDAAALAHLPDLAQAIGGIVSLPRTHLDLEPLSEALALLTSLVEHVGLDTLTQHPADEQAETATQLPHALDVLATWLGGSSGKEAKEQMIAGETWSVVPVVFALAQAPEALPISSSTTLAALKAWKVLSTDPQAVTSVQSFVRKHFGQATFSTPVIVALARAAAALGGTSGSGGLQDLLPSGEELGALSVQAIDGEGQPSILAVVDELIPPSSTEQQLGSSAPTLDQQDLSIYIRNVLAHLQLCEEDRSYRDKSAWLLPHYILVGIISEDWLLHSSSWSSSISSSASTGEIQGILDRVIKVATATLSALASALSHEWHAAITSSLQSGAGPTTDSSGLGQALLDTWLLAKGSKSAVRYRVLSRLLSGILTFSSAEAQDAERWLRLAQHVQAQDADLSQAIIVSAKSLALSTPLYERMCNEAAARLAGVPPPKANSEGLTLLRVANAIAPPLNAENAFVPQQRAMFLLQALQKWVASDEDLDDEINTQLARLFVHLAPIVQGLSGSHLDFFVDVIEANLDLAVDTLEEDDGIPSLYHTLRLLTTIMDLASANATLREVYQPRQASIAELVSKLFTGLAPSASSPTSRQSIPREICNNILVDLIHRIPESQRAGLVKSTDKLAALLSHRAQQVQVISYRLLRAYIHERVQEAVVAAAVEGQSSSSELSILPALMQTASQDANELLSRADIVAERHDLFGFLLTWLAILDHFEEGSLQLKSVYLAQLQKTDIVTTSMLPVIFGLFALTQNVHPFDASKFAVDEIWLDDLELSRISTIQALAGHVFYRSLIHMPALIRNWWYSIKDRQLSMQVTSFTTRHCSPLLAAKELAHLRGEDALAQLQDEALAVRVLSGSNEVIATYTVDEHPMEIGIRLPADYPLHGAEIRDIKRVGGVSEAQWRAWLLAVQQLVSSRNGLVFDALMLFKKNAEAKFSGFEGRECAICYSIISPIDESLPTKPCKTCKNAFHSSCLLKWVVQSGSSTCPLCRSII